MKRIQEAKPRKILNVKTISHKKSETFLAPINVKRVLFNAQIDTVHVHVKKSLNLLQLNYKLNGFKNFSYDSPVPNFMKFHSTVCEFIYAHRCYN